MTVPQGPAAAHKPTLAETAAGGIVWVTFAEDPAWMKRQLMYTELGDIFSAIECKWRGANQHDSVKAFLEAPQGASTGTEGLMMILEYLTEMSRVSPDLIDLVQDEMLALVEYCANHGIVVNDDLKRDG